VVGALIHQPAGTEKPTFVLLPAAVVLLPDNALAVVLRVVIASCKGNRPHVLLRTLTVDGGLSPDWRMKRVIAGEIQVVGHMDPESAAHQEWMQQKEEGVDAKFIAGEFSADAQRLAAAQVARGKGTTVSRLEEKDKGSRPFRTRFRRDQETAQLELEDPRGD